MGTSQKNSHERVTKDNSADSPLPRAHHTQLRRQEIPRRMAVLAWGPLAWAILQHTPVRTSIVYMSNDQMAVDVSQAEADIPAQNQHQIGLPQVLPPTRSVAQRTAVHRVPAFLDDASRSELHALAGRVRRDAGEVESGELTKSSGNWKTVYLNHQLAELPELLDGIVRVAREADAANGWDLLSSNELTLNLRCAELHTVLRSGGLPKPTHYDEGSLVTVDIMLSSPGSDFCGGAFQTLEYASEPHSAAAADIAAAGVLQPHTFELGDALVFLSHKYHCVAPVTAGRRQVLVCELWNGVQRCCARRCLDPWGPCACHSVNIVQYRRSGDSASLCAMPPPMQSERSEVLDTETRRRSGCGSSHRVWTRRHGRRKAASARASTAAPMQALLTPPPPSTTPSTD